MRQNIVIIGMPGVGKTTIAREIGRLYHIPVIDIDEEIVKTHGDIPAIFAERGEAGFRAIEKEKVHIAAKAWGVVIATGGGSVLDPENVEALRKGGKVYWLRRPLEELSSDGRPLSADGLQAVEKLWQERKHIYDASKDVIVHNVRIRDAAEEIVRDFREE